MALAKLPRGKIKSYNGQDYGQDFFFFSFFSLHDAKKKLWAFSKKIFSLCLSKLSKKEGGESSKARKEKFYPFFFKRKKFRF